MEAIKGGLGRRGGFWAIRYHLQDLLGARHGQAARVTLRILDWASSPWASFSVVLCSGSDLKSNYIFVFV